MALEPSNAAGWAGSANTELDFALLLLRTRKVAEATAAIDRGCDRASQLIARDPTIDAWRDANRSCLRLRAELAMTQGAKDEALFLARQVLEAVRSDRKVQSTDPFALAQAHKLLATFCGSGRSNRRGQCLEGGIAAWPRVIAETPRQLAERGAMLRGTGQRARNQIGLNLQPWDIANRSPIE